MSTVLTAAFSVAIAVVAGLYAFAFYINHTNEPPPTFYLHSTAPYQAVQVPFSLRDGKIYLPMVVSGWKMEGMLDTGGFNMIWNQDLHLRGRTTLRSTSVTDAANNKIKNAKQVVIPSIRFGNYEVRGLTTYAIDTRVVPKSMIGGLVDQTPLVGNEAFCTSVLTIDYYQKEIIVRNASYDFTKEPLAANVLVLPFRRRVSANRNFYGKPTVRTSINGVPAGMEIDTGWPGRVALNEAFATKALPESARNVPKYKDSKGNLSYLYPPVRVAFHQTSLTSPDEMQGTPPAQKPEWLIPAMGYPRVKQRCDAIVGYNLLRFFRVTIDYPRQKILLEPYGDDKVRLLPKGSLFTTIDKADKKSNKTRLSHDEVLCRHADGTITLTP